VSHHDSKNCLKQLYSWCNFDNWSPCRRGAQDGGYSNGTIWRN